MTRIRSLFPRATSILGIVSVAVVGMTIATAQNQTEPKPAQPKAATKPRTDQPAPPANRNQPAAPRDDRPAAEGQRTAPRGDRPAAEGQRSAGLGVQFQAQGDQGLQVSAVEQNSVFAQAGLRQNDRIVSIEGMTFNSPRQLEAFLFAQTGRPVPIIIDRGGQRYTVRVTVPVGEADSGWLGVFLEQGDDKVKGAQITHVYPASPAARGGLQSGDIIMQIDGQQIENSHDVVMTIREFQPQAQIEMVVQRDQEQLKIPVVLGSRAASDMAWNTERQPRYQSGYQQQPGQFQQQPGQQQFGGQRSSNSHFDGIPPYAMQLEHERRAAEQHERIEEEIRLLREEIKQLREHLEGKRGSKDKTNNSKDE